MPDRTKLILLASGLTAILLLASSGRCEEKRIHRFTVTAYCSCSQCCGWERGSWKFLKMDVWNRYVSRGERAGRLYDGRTASGTKPHAPQPGLFSFDSLKSPWMIPPRVAFFPWLAFPQMGTIAADTDHYPFGTRMYVPGYGWGVVEDRGSAIKGPDRIDLYMSSHGEALHWGRQQVVVEVQLPGKN
ncbi:MAG: Cell wall-binding protein YocH precursor [Candidatus Hinthialibacteria bacterium OLB16]|nr:MAG: Cell wall-binding protein YocH precursor [Candidatus Hinthialibacteria bacterium OLB16]